MLDAHSKSGKKADPKEKEVPGIWDRDRDRQQMPAPPGAFPSAPPPAPPAPSKSSKKKAKKASKAALPAPPSPTDSASSLPPLEDVSASPTDLLSTASDLYRQIEAAAASALSTHPSFAASFPPPPDGTGGHPPTTDEAYWTSLPQHLRQFIRCVLPLTPSRNTHTETRLTRASPDRHSRSRPA